MKKKAAGWAFLLLGGMVALGLFWSFNHSLSDGKLTLLSEAFRQPEKPAPTSPPVARYQVGDNAWLTVTQQDVLRQKAIMDIPGGWPTKPKVVLDVLVQNLALQDEARRRGLEFSRANAVAMARQQQELYARGALPGQEDMRALIMALDMNENTFWTEFAPEWYERLRLLSVAQLRQSLTPSEMKALNNALQRKLRLEILDSAFFGTSK